MFLLIAGVLVAALLYQLRFIARRKALAVRGWQDVAAELKPVNMFSLRSVAQRYLKPDELQLEIEPAVLWEMVGGFDGLKRLRANACLMLELAVIAEGWRFTEGVIIAEMLRRDSARLHQAARGLQWQMTVTGECVRAPFLLQEAASSYCLMTARLLGLYRVAHTGALPVLESALLTGC